MVVAASSAVISDVVFCVVAAPFCRAMLVPFLVRLLVALFVGLLFVDLDKRVDEIGWWKDA
jgi:hypothetical protein